MIDKYKVSNILKFKWYTYWAVVTTKNKRRSFEHLCSTLLTLSAK